MLISREMLERVEIEVRGDWDEWLSLVTIDSRAVESGCLFWALPGSKKHGQDFVENAFAAGAKIVAVERKWADAHSPVLTGKAHFVMKDTLKGLQNLAREIRGSVGAQVLAITGSNGKTTTKELAAAALETAGTTSASQGNYNNHIGLPLTLLNLKGDEAFVVLEMGANHVGEIAALCEIGHPELGLITNIGDAHVGEFGGYAKLQMAKGELFDFLGANDSLAVVNLDDPKVVQESRKVPRKVGYTLHEAGGSWTGSIYQGRIVERDAWSRTTFEVDGLKAKLRLPGSHWTSLALGAFAAAMEMGVDPSLAMASISAVEPLEGRGHILDLGDGIELLDDAYNANKASIVSVLETLSKRPGKRIAVLGDILELGEWEEEEHRKIGQLKSLATIDRVYFVGKRMALAAEEAEQAGHAGVVKVYEDEVVDLSNRIVKELESGAGVIVKGSRLMGLDRVVKGLTDLRSVAGGKR
ncbi:MAG: UDP-N-acetylmuramoyl-tripeptide--D-alanyl-D-alanine ligase [bacterium]